MEDAIEEIVIRLASGNVGKSLTLTKEQQALGSIPTSLVYLAGLVCKSATINHQHDKKASSVAQHPLFKHRPTTTTTTTILTAHRNRFLELQRIYNEHMIITTNGGHEEGEKTKNLYHLSPRLLPTAGKYCSWSERCFFILITKFIPVKI